MTSRSYMFIPAFSLVAALAMAPVAPEAGNALFLLGGALGLFLIWPIARSEFSRPIVWMPLAGLLAVGVAYIIGAGLQGLEGLLFFLPMLAVLPLVVLLRDIASTQFHGPISLLAFCGTAGAAVMAVVEVQTTGTSRAGSLVANPIHFADVALLVGILSMVGTATAIGWRRAAFVAFPFVAVVPVVLSGTRGAVVALGIALAVGVLSSVLVQLVSRRTALIGSAFFLAVVVVIFFLGGSQLSGVQRVVADVLDTLANGAPGDSSTDLRLQMYMGGFRAFLASPIFGHGPIIFTQVADSLSDHGFGGAPHLHNDLVDMGASAGILGLSAYFLFVAAPIVEALRMPPSEENKWVIVISTTFVSSFVVMGLTNAMFGILTVTCTFAAGSAIIGALASSTRRSG